MLLGGTLGDTLGDTIKCFLNDYKCCYLALKQREKALYFKVTHPILHISHCVTCCNLMCYCFICIIQGIDVLFPVFQLLNHSFFHIYQLDLVIEN